MEGYGVIGSDGGKLGHVVAVEGDLLVLEEGHLRKTRYAIPKAFVRVEPAPKHRAESREGRETGVRGRQIIPPDPHDPL